jgi:hypothetical protein
MKIAVTGMLLATSLAGITAPATARADDPVPTTDQVLAIMAELTDPNIPAANKGDIVTPGFTPDEAGTIDDHLNRMNGKQLPLNFVVTDIEPAPTNLAGATLATVGAPSPKQLRQTNSAGRSGRALADHPRHRHGRAGRVLAHREPLYRWNLAPRSFSLRASLCVECAHCVLRPQVVQLDCTRTGQPAPLFTVSN